MRVALALSQNPNPFHPRSRILALRVLLDRLEHVPCAQQTCIDTAQGLHLHTGGPVSAYGDGAAQSVLLDPPIDCATLDRDGMAVGQGSRGLFHRLNGGDCRCLPNITLRGATVGDDVDAFLGQD